MTLAEVRRMLLILARQLSTALAADRRCSGLLPVPSRYRRPQNAETKGYWLQVGRLGRGMRVELWLDHYSGLSYPRAWCGVSSTSSQQFSRLLAHPPLAGLRKRLLKRSGHDVTSSPPYHFIHPLRSNEFDVLVQEYYAGERDYLGVFSNYPWPFSPQNQGAIVRDATNLVAAFCAAFQMASNRQTIRTQGPWARPDPKCEKAAVRHVRRYLERSNYQVKSREHEICGYDLHATRASEELHIEVKGCTGAERRFFISRTERRAAGSDPRWRLAIITNALHHPPRPQFLTGAQMIRAFALEPVQWEGHPAFR